MRIMWAVLWVVLWVVGSAACGISKISRDGPKPKPTGVARADQGFPTEAVLCSDRGGTLVISGEGLSPMPKAVLTDHAGVALPAVVFRSADGTVVMPFSVTFDPVAKSLIVVPNIPMAAGSYDIVVTNPNGNSGTLASGLQVVPPPQVTAVAPSSGPNNVATPVAVLGTDFRVASDGTQPGVALTPNAGGATTALGGVAWQSASDVAATVNTGLAVGSYDLTLTNPEGCSATLPNAFQVTQPPTIDLCNKVDPAFGWVNGRTTIQICANNANGHGLVPIPESFILVDPVGDGQNVTEVALIREAFLSASTSSGGFANASVMSAVVPAATEPRGAGIVVGGPYAVKVLNPDGSEAVIPNAFEVLADPPPRITNITPQQAEKSAAVTMHIFGQALKDPSTALSPRLARVLFLTADLAAGAACAGPTCYECANPAVITAGTAVDCAPPLGSMGSGSYLVRYEHVDDGTYSDFAAFAVTNPSGNLTSATRTMPTLVAGRFAHGAALGRDDLGNRFMYVVGGQSGVASSTALDTVEVAALDRFGGLSAWNELPVRLPKKLASFGLAQSGNYIFVVGGQDEVGTIQTASYRSRILGADTAPVIGAPTAVAGALGAGTYSYRVSAVMAAATDNEGGESLPSDAESLRLAAAGGVQVSWQAVTGADSYRIYRTATANELAGNEVLVATGITGTTYTDDGSATPSTIRPQPPGATGVWMTASPLVAGRRDMGVTIANDQTGRSYLYVLGGLTPASGVDPVNTYELAELTESGGIVALGAFATGSLTMDIPSLPVAQRPRPRAELIATTLSGETAPLIAGLGEQYVVAAQGATSTVAYTDISLARVGTNGQLDAFELAHSSASADRYGSAGFLANNFLFSIGGRSASGGYDSKGKTGEVCPARNGTCATQSPPVLTWAGGDSGITLSVGRYRPGAVYVAGYFYFTGGRSDATTVLGSCERGGYAP
jgi:hypothetical protein